MARQERGYSYAKKAATMSVHRNRVGAAIIVGRKRISIGWNVIKTHPLSSRCTTHAEIQALKGRDVVGGSIYVVRLLRNNTLGMSRPCSKCLETLRLVGINRIYYYNGRGEALNENIQRDFKVAPSILN